MATYYNGSCPPPVTTSYVSLGGIADGHTMSIKSAGCLPTTNSYVSLGGAYDGHTYSLVLNSSCPPVLTTTIVSFGGTDDGHSLGIYLEPACPPYITNSYVSFGGIDDGYRLADYSNNSNSCVALPITLLSFDASCKNYNPVLSWKTASEINNDYFTIERSPDAKYFYSIGHVKGAGNSTHNVYYTFVDNDNINNTYYYRLKQTDFDGNYNYSKLISANCSDQNSSISMYPTPNDGIFKIIQAGDTKKLTITILNVIGQTILKRSTSKNITAIDISNNPDGMYYVLIATEQGEIVTKITIKE